MQIVDANIVLRYVLSDCAELSEKAKVIIEENVVEVPIEVLCEVVYVLSSVYRVSRKDIYRELTRLFAETQCEIPHRASVLRGLELFAQEKMYFADCILAGYSESESAVIQPFDKQLLKRLSNHS